MHIPRQNTQTLSNKLWSGVDQMGQTCSIYFIFLHLYHCLTSSHPFSSGIQGQSLNPAVVDCWHQWCHNCAAPWRGRAQRNVPCDQGYTLCYRPIAAARHRASRAPTISVAPVRLQIQLTRSLSSLSLSRPKEGADCVSAPGEVEGSLQLLCEYSISGKHGCQWSWWFIA